MINLYSKLFCPIIILFYLLFPNIGLAYLSDPTKPKVNTEEQVSKVKGTPFNLQSILIGRMRRLAMINEQIVSVGSSINGARVLAIDKNHVVLLYSGRKVVLYLFGKRLWTKRR
ncbi:hypothetical protein [Legionella quateirensis]|uniref:MSHA biogenesis protein MshK n=1 Tax=Legionella quateirensis TaxID=45072 RepID=A0A378KWQ8_9GAMM|nr:hypothetical protein [Legionella quateirensis]KTD50724.1 hypothetical protein Lqua_0951 [Legionella quateirensis]STY18031.1 Uncharacterised protein [Legionella quateirensis]